jgi:hypothetical protein
MRPVRSIELNVENYKCKAPRVAGLKTHGIRYARVSSERPIENAFWRVAPSVRLSDFAMAAAGLFFLAMALSVRTCSALQATRFRFFGIRISVGKNEMAYSVRAPKRKYQSNKSESNSASSGLVRRNVEAVIAIAATPFNVAQRAA